MYNGVTYYYILNGQGDVVRLVDSTGAVVASYEYDPYGKILSATGSMAEVNPLRYRGYYYDAETGFYYVNSRYYDPGVGRFLNADGYASTGQGLVGFNMFAYCGNNPVNCSDPSGQFWSSVWNYAKTVITEIGKAMSALAPAYAACGGLALLDGPAPFGDLLGVAGTALFSIGAVGVGVEQATRIYEKTKTKEKAKEKVAAITSEPSSTVIYRYYASKTENLSPRPKIDYDGLSFSTKPPRSGVSAVVTTIESVNATGILTAIPDGGAHVTIVPTNGTVNQWMDQGQSSIWSQTLAGIVIEWDGGN